ncbi:MAG: preprotein translocase subunit SecE [bacterium]|nr:preprotein translocase subunit SecE [bacterium]
MTDTSRQPIETTDEQAPEELDTSLSLKGGGISLGAFGWARGTTKFLGDVQSEFRLISWPTRQQVLLETVVVIAVVTFLGVLVVSLDWIFALVANRFLV